MCWVSNLDTVPLLFATSPILKENSMMELMKTMTKPNPNPKLSPKPSDTKMQQIQERQMTKASEFARMVYEKQTAGGVKLKIG